MSFVTRQRAVAVLIGVILSVVSLVLTGPVSAAPIAHRAPLAVPTIAGKLAPAGSVPMRRACEVPSKPGIAACDAIVRTDAAASRQGKLAPGVAPAGYGSADLQSAYKLPSATAGAGATVAVIDAYDDPSAAADLAVYRQRNGLPPCTTANGCFRKVDQRGGTAFPPGDLGWAVEISLDLDMVSAACPKCHILLVEADSANATDLGAAVNEAVALGARYVSNSYSVAGAPQALETQWDAQYYNHPGAVITASSGDIGFDNQGYGPSFPADSPHVVGVGGTSLMRDPASPRGWSETAWSDTGSGCGTLPNPPWQGRGIACNNTGGGAPISRAYSDVSAVADPATGVAVYDSFGLSGWQVIGGTSASSPLIAATYALAGKPVGGSYPAARLYTDHASLNDITTGNNNGGDTSCGVICTAGPGWDGPTGWGTPIGVADFAAGPHGTVSGTVTDRSGKPVVGAQVMIGNATAITDGAGRYTTTALDGAYTPSASKYGYSSQTAAPVTVTTGGTVTQNFTLTRQPLAIVTGTVRDASGHGWPLYAEITVPGTPVVAYSDPATGKYSLQLPVIGQAYTLHTSAQFLGYQASDTPITPAAGSQRQDIGLSADPANTSCPAGYRQRVSGLSEDFSTGKIPVGWTLQSNDSTGMQWVFNNPNHRVNNTGGTGGFALVDGFHPPPTVSVEDSTWLTSPVINMSASASPVLKFSQNLQFGTPGPFAEVSVSTDGGQSWYPVYVKQSPADVSVTGPDAEAIPLPQAARQPKVQLRFTAFSMYPGSLWEVDNVLAGQQSCQPVPGGLVTGIVRDKNTGQPVNGATVSGGGQQVTTTPEPGDPSVGGGLYQMFAPAGPRSLTASAGGYSPGASNVTVAVNAVTLADFTLAAGRLAVSPGGISVKTVIGGTDTASVKVTNTGSAPVTIHPAVQAGPVTIAGQATRRAGPGAPLKLVAGHFSPAPGLAAVSGPLRQRLQAALRQTGRAAAPSPGPWVPPWTQVEYYPDYGFDMAAATDPATGKVYVTGGVTNGDSNTSTTHGYVYDPARGAWSPLPDMPQGREAAVTAVIGGKLYVTAGSGSSGSEVAELDVYDLRTGLWSQRAPIPHPYYGSGAAVLDSKLYVIGGCHTDQSLGALCTSTDVQVYDPATDAWSRAAAYPRLISFLGCGAIGGKIYCAGGFDHNLQRGTTAAYAFDPAASKWTPVAPMPIDLWGAASTAANGQLLVSGGITRDDQILTNQGFAYDPVANAWSPLPNAPDDAYRGASACGFYTIGGIDQQGYATSAATELLPGYTGCDGGVGVGWLTPSPGQVTLAPGQSTTVTLKVDASAARVPQPGTYTATLSVNSGAPQVAPRVPVTLTATPPASWAGLTGVISGRDCNGTVTPLDGATVQVNSAVGGWPLTTSPDGRYALWRPASDSPLSLIVTASHWLARTATARLTAGKVTNANLTLTRPSCGRGGHAAVPGPGPIVSRGVWAACGTPLPGHAQCFALVRTDIKVHGPSAAGMFTPSGYGPADLRGAYKLPSGAAGAGQTVAIVDAYDDPSAAADLAAYRAQYGLPPCTAASGCFRKVAQDGTGNYPLPDGSWAVEISLDLDMVSAICPRCRILLVEAKSASLTDLGAAVNEAVALGAKYVSNSYGSYENTNGLTSGAQASADQLYYNHPGVAVTAAAGDSAYGVSYPAASPDVVAVGGTSLTRDSSVKRGWSETAWSGTGSGCSASEPKPAWQHDSGCANRTVADVSAVADPYTGVAIYDTYTSGSLGIGPGWNVFGGTSAASPIMASVYALAGTPSAAANPASYPYAEPAALNDITSGGNGSCSPAYLCTAGPGYDGPTGLGTPAGVAAFWYGVHGSHGDVAGAVTDAATGKPVAGARVSAGGYAALTDAAGHYVLAASPGAVTVTVSAYGYTPKTVPGVTVNAGQTQTENIALSGVPMETVSGTVSDGSGHHWPLYAQVSVPGTPAVTHTDPVTGHYSVRLPAGSYTLQADPLYPGYQPVSQQVNVTTTNIIQDLAAQVDPAACDALGYHPATVLNETFDADTIPSGWSIVNPPDDGPGNTWRFDKPGSYPNETGGSGNYAAAYANTSYAADTELLTPVLNMSADPSPRLQFDNFVSSGYPVTESVELSTDGGSTWSTVWTTDNFAPQQITVPLPQAAGRASVRLRFHFSAPALEEGDIRWEIDNVSVTDCSPSVGGLVTGQVTDANSGQGVDGATIGGGQPGVTVTSMPVPGDPRNPHGFYALFAAPGTHAITATATGYAAATTTASVTADQATRTGMTMKAGRVIVSGGPVTGSVTLGGSTTATVTVRNTGSSPATVHFDPRPGGFTPAGPMAADRGYPLIRIPGQFSPDATRPLSVSAAQAGPRSAVGSALAWSDNAPWTRVADLPTALAAVAGAVDPATGKVYAVGGARDYSRVTGDLTVFDPATGRWSALPAMPHPRYAPQAAFIAGNLYITGGAGPFTSGTAPQLDIYNTISRTWTSGTPVPHDYDNAATVALNGKMYIIGGCDPNGNCGATDVQVYNPVTDHWSAAAAYPLAVSHLGCGVITGKIYCAGGVSSTWNSGTRAGYVYDPKANAWAPIADMPGELWGGAYGAADDQLLISGGITALGTVLTNQGYAYDPATNTWGSLPNAPQATYEGGSACGFYALGGWTYFTQSGSAAATGAVMQLPGYGGCGGQDWLSASPATATVRPGQTATVKVTLSAAVPSVTQPGSYTASLRVSNDTPYGVSTVPVTFTVTPPRTWGKLAGTVTGKSCADTTGPLAGASVQVTAGQSTWTLTTDPGGRYALWLHSASNVSVITSQQGWQPQATTFGVSAGTTTTHDFTLNQICG